jgi:rSAM/selenodomain-associated transferase 1
MAKAPRVGDVKTRLVPPLSPPDDTALSGCFIRDIAENILVAGESASIDGYVAYSPPGSENVFMPLLPCGVRLLPSRRPGLGYSLFDAAEDLLAAGYGAVCLVNSDSPTLPTELLVQAAQTLAMPGDRVVLGPADDGGYYLIGLKRPHRRLFDDIAWSTEQVFRQTLDRVNELALDVVMLSRWYDVDDLDSLRRLMTEIAASAAGKKGYPAPFTAALLQDLRSRVGAPLFGTDAAAPIGRP